MPTAPTPSEFELSVIGPGYGEALLVHVGGGHWVLIDSCLDSASKRPAALAYLESIGVDPATQVELVVATHWHDDHTRGIAEVVRACKVSRFACSSALTQKEFLTLTQAYGGSGGQWGTSELANVLAALIERAKPPTYREGPTQAIADRLLYRSTFTLGAQPLTASVTALSPSDAACALAVQGFAKLLPDPWTLRKRVGSVEPNAAAVALWIECGDVKALLGSDLEEMGDSRMGWSAVVNSQTRPLGRAELFKIPHHGSVSAHNEQVWTELLDADRTSALTPFSRAATELPTATDRTRIKALTQRCFVSADPASRPKINRPNKVKQLIALTAKRLEVAEPHTGHVRFRTDLLDGSAPTVELFAGAQAL